MGITKFRNFAFAAVILAACWAHATPALANEEVELLLESALEHGYGTGNIAEASGLLLKAARLAPDRSDVQVSLSKALLTLGDATAAARAATRALELAPESAGAFFVKARSSLLNGDIDAALQFAKSPLEQPGIVLGPGDRGGLSLTVAGLLMRAGRFDEAEKFLLHQRPGLASLADEPLPGSVEEMGGGWHAISTLAHIYREQGRTERADRLLARLSPYDEDWVKKQNEGELDAISLWNLAATGAGRIPDEQALDYLEQAVDGGFVMLWRYNFEQHPTLWPLRSHPRFRALIARLESEMQRQRAAMERSKQLK
jgi:tetratricopeptide (TPR) repeat protein